MSESTHVSASISSAARYGRGQASPQRRTSSQRSTAVNRQLQQLVDECFRQNPRLTLNALSLKSGVPEPTLRRIWNCQTKTLPAIGNVCSLLFYLFKVNHFSDLLERLDGELKEHLEEHYRFWGSEDFAMKNPELHQRLVKVFKCKDTYLFFRLAKSRQGVSEKVVSRLLPESWQTIASVLGGEGWVERIGDRYRAVAGIEIPRSMFKENFKSFADRLRTDGEANVYNILVENVSEAAFREILSLQRKTVHEIQEILQREGSRGELPVFYLSGFDRLLDN